MTPVPDEAGTASPVDVVVVNYRSGLLLPAVVELACEWLGPRAVVTVVDNSPEDGVVERARRARPGVRVIRNHVNRGFAFAVNQALGATAAPYVLLLNPDIRRIEGSFSSIEALFAEHPDVAAVAPRLVFADGSLQLSARREPRLRDLFVDIFGLRHRLPAWGSLFEAQYGDWDYSTTRVVDAAIGAFLVLRREALAHVGLLDPGYFVYAEETDWLIRAKRLGWKTMFTPDVQAVHDVRGSTDAGEVALLLLLVESEHRYVRKHFGAATAVAFRASALLVDALRWLVAALRGGPKRAHRQALEDRILVHLGRRRRSLPRPGTTAADG